VWGFVSLENKVQEREDSYSEERNPEMRDYISTPKPAIAG
jgi:hypothetical protein